MPYLRIPYHNMVWNGLTQFMAGHCQKMPPSFVRKYSRKLRFSYIPFPSTKSIERALQAWGNSVSKIHYAFKVSMPPSEIEPIGMATKYESRWLNLLYISSHVYSLFLTLFLQYSIYQNSNFLKNLQRNIKNPKFQSNARSFVSFFQFL